MHALIRAGAVVTCNTFVADILDDVLCEVGLGKIPVNFESLDSMRLPSLSYISLWHVRFKLDRQQRRALDFNQNANVLSRHYRKPLVPLQMRSKCLPCGHPTRQVNQVKDNLLGLVKGCIPLW